MLFRSLIRYRRIQRSILYLIGAELLLHLINTSFMLILNIHLKKEGYVDEEIANFLSYRFLGVLALATPVGLLIKGLKLKPFFIASAIIIPAASMLILEAVDHDWEVLVRVGLFSWGIGLMLLQVCVLPFIMRHASMDVKSEAISLSYATFSFGLLLSGAMIFILSKVELTRLWGYEIWWDEDHVLRFIIITATTGIYFMLRIRETAPPRKKLRNIMQAGETGEKYDWGKILTAVTPTIIIAVGAGLTIPFINLFFYGVFGMDSDTFSIIGSFTAILVFSGALITPILRRNFGFKKSITISQSLAVMFLVLMALTELVSGYEWAVFIAVGCYMMRQPLMNMAQPATSELTMSYVGEKNQELMSALTSSIWSGSWFLSAIIFQILRKQDLPYYQIFLITAMLYMFGVVNYYWLIKKYERSVVRNT